VAKKLVASDYKNNRVDDPTIISDKQQSKVRRYVKEYFYKAVAKKAEHDKRAKAKERAAKGSNGNSKGEDSKAPEEDLKAEESDEDIHMSDDEAEEADTSLGDAASNEDLKRKRVEDLEDTEGEGSSKRLKDSATPEPPPPPPPPPMAELKEKIRGEAELQAQEEALMRENEEALRKENEDAAREEEEKMARAKENEGSWAANGTVTMVNGNGNGVCEADVSPEVKMEETKEAQSV
jgi:hypothetical protein